MSKEETKLVDLEIQEMLRKAVISLTNESEDQLLCTLFLVRTKDGGDRPLIHLKEVEQINPIFSFQNGRSLSVKINPTARRLNVQNRL